VQRAQGSRGKIWTALCALLIAIALAAGREGWWIRTRIRAIEGVAAFELDSHEDSYEGTVRLENGGRIDFKARSVAGLDAPDLVITGIGGWRLVASPCDRVDGQWQPRPAIAFGAVRALLTGRPSSGFRDLVDHYAEIEAGVLAWPTEPTASRVLYRASPNRFDRYWRTTWDGSPGVWFDHDCDVPASTVPSAPARR
jgi:hypothetical protein